MATFSYEAVDGQGNEVRAEIEADDEKDANDKIRALDYYPTKVTPKGAALGAPLAPGFRMRSPDPALMRSRFAWMFA